MSKMTIKEIARLAKVSPTAVSFVLNNRKGVSDETRKKVKRLVEQLGYTPNPSSRRLIFNKTNNIAVLFRKSISPLEHFFYSEVNNAVLHECEQLGYNLIFASVKTDDNTVELPNVVKSYDVDGIIFYGDIDTPILNAISRYDIPFIFIDSHRQDPDVLSITADYAAAAYIAVGYLIELGHKSIGYIGNSFLRDFSSQTFAGYRKAMEESNLSALMHWVQMEAQDETSAYECMKSIVSGSQSPTAVFCCADIYAIGAVNFLKGKGLRVPDDISIVSIDDILLARYTDPPLTTVRIDKVEMGKMAIKLLVKKIQGEPAQSIMMGSNTLIVRNSARAAGER